MNGPIPRDRLIEAIRAGVSRTTGLIARLTEYHGGPVGTEYLLTADIAREFIERDYEVRVECLNRDAIHGMNSKEAGRRRQLLRSKRTDVAIFESIFPRALIEIKIGVSSLRKLRLDLDKICTTIALLDSLHASKVTGACVFEVHVSNSKLYTRDALLSRVRVIEERIRSELQAYAHTRPAFSFEWEALQAEDGGIIERDTEYVGDELAWGEHGHATRYHAILIHSRVTPLAPAPLFPRKV